MEEGTVKARELEDFCLDERPQLVAAVTAYCGDPDVAEEVAQEALARACDRWDDVREKRSPGAWTYRVAVNLVNDRFRRRSVERRVRRQLAEPDGWYRDRDAATVVAVRRAVGMLPPRQRAAVTLRYLLDWTVAETAEALGISDGAVRSLTHRGVTALREHFARSGDQRLLRILAAIGVVVLVAVASVAAVALARAQPAPVYIDDGALPVVPSDATEGAPAEAVPSDDGGGTTPTRIGSDDLELRVTGDLDGRYVLSGPHYTGSVEPGPGAEANDAIRFGRRHRAVIQLSHDPRPGEVFSGADVHVTLVLDGRDFFASDGECTVTVEDSEVHDLVGAPPRTDVTALSMTCSGLDGGRGGDRMTIDVDGWWRP